MSSHDLHTLLSAAILRLQVQSPFFATLALFCQYLFSREVETASTDGKVVFLNPDVVMALSRPELDTLLLHEILHAAFLHTLRRQERSPYLWNYAADIVVNGVLAELAEKSPKHFKLLESSIREPDLERLSVEEIYELLQKHSLDKRPSCLQEHTNEVLAPNELKAHWKQALQQASIVQAQSGRGAVPQGMQRLLDQVTAPQLDWRSLLWRFLVKTPTDFADFDRRHIYRGLYLETLCADAVRVHVAIDTSGSIEEEQLAMFLAELGGILAAYPHLTAELYYADSALYGPYSLEKFAEIPRPQGGGGTSFVPFFAHLADSNALPSDPCVYLTDGHGDFPSEARPNTLWVVTPGGLVSEDFPFGDVLRLLD
jgi:predicted metal-dependent peptidase